MPTLPFLAEYLCFLLQICEHAGSAGCINTKMFRFITAVLIKVKLVFLMLHGRDNSLLPELV